MKNKELENNKSRIVEGFFMLKTISKKSNVDTEINEKKLYLFDNIENLLKINNIEYSKRGDLFLFTMDMERAYIFIQNDCIWLMSGENKKIYTITENEGLSILFNVIESNFDFNNNSLQYMEV